ncbi:hypothetical protein [Methylomonas sp. UP202]|uniref:hypothetical protein n=1 Tax=Methylomonas sp. UP202 TaxID=3040943 RepID=UPI002479F2FC|nr:hypothetical protein [Methylomonas sp. UP202]WGS83829.1 hypothetical protein QC632_12240 [Methylomonas sp. UP202]
MNFAVDAAPSPLSIDQKDRRRDIHKGFRFGEVNDPRKAQPIAGRTGNPRPWRRGVAAHCRKPAHPASGCL